jgi:hypothetical protein
MDVKGILAEIDAKIASLHAARTAILQIEGSDSLKPKRGRPKGSVNAPKPAKAKKRKRNLSPEGRKRIAEAMKRRWAERRKELAKKDSAKK